MMETPWQSLRKAKDKKLDFQSYSTRLLEATEAMSWQHQRYSSGAALSTNVTDVTKERDFCIWIFGKSSREQKDILGSIEFRWNDQPVCGKFVSVLVELIQDEL